MDNSTNYLQKNRARLIPFAILAFLAVATFFTLSLTRQRQDLQQSAVTDTGTLTFANVSSGTVSPGNSFTVSVNMNGGNKVVVGADILINFDSSKLELTGLTKNTQNNNPYKTYAPVDTNGNFDTQRVIDCANSGGSLCPSGAGTVEFGIVSFDWSGNALTTPNATTSNLSPVTTLTFLVKPGATGSTTVSFKNDGITSTTDSNIVVNPANGNPEDILKAPDYNNRQFSVTIGGSTPPSARPSPSTSARPSPSSSPTPPPSGGTCVPAATSGCRDTNGDGVLNVFDINPVGVNYGATTSSPAYSYQLDQNCDGVLNVFDINELGTRYNQQSCSR